MPSFNATTFVNDVARDSARRLGIPQDTLGQAFDAAKLTLPGSLLRQQPGQQPWEIIWLIPRGQMASEVWIIARMALDVRTMIAAAGEDAVLDHADLHELGWAADQVRTYARVSLAIAMASIKAEAASARRDAAHQQHFTGYATAMSWAAAALIVAGIAATFGIGLVATALATV